MVSADGLLVDAVGYCCHGNCGPVIGWQLFVLISHMASDQVYVIVTGLTSFVSHTHLVLRDPGISLETWSMLKAQ